MSESKGLDLPEGQPGRPQSYANLLSRPLAIDGVGDSYAGWEQDHGGARSFYVGGFRWFLFTSGIDDFRQIAPFGAGAVGEARDKTLWTDMPESGGRWEECGLPQFKFARKKDATYFQKAALAILACDQALTKRLEEGGKVREKITPEDIYNRMKVIPACWHIEEFDLEEYRKLKNQYPEAEADLKKLASQQARTFVEHLAKGYTTTFETADTVRRYIAEKCKGVTVGRVIPMPGKQLGTLGATRFEEIDAG